MTNLEANVATNMEEEKEKYECCVCWEVKKYSFRGFTEFNGLCCQHMHKVCFTCVKKLLRECRSENCKCLGYNWKCPLCRGEAGLGRADQLVAVMSGSWKTVTHFRIKTDEEEESE